jgi:Pyruvate/2-oxoacid:ferredoxin oxidoreductase delta subunit
MNHMVDQVYREMLEVMNRRGGLYSGLDIQEFYDLVEALFTPPEVRVNNALPMTSVTASELAAKMEWDEEEVNALLEAMADKGLCRTTLQNGVRYFKGESLMPGILEFQFLSGKATEREKGIAQLIQAYKKAYDTVEGPIKLNFPRNRVITVDRAIDAGNTIHTYDQVTTYINQGRPMAVGVCYCRHLAHLLDEDIHGLPVDVCMWFGGLAEFAIERLNARPLTRNEARDLLNRCEEAGLVHMSRNLTEDIEFLCNCDRWHCRAMKIILAQPKPALFFNSGFQPRFNPDRCTACETCLERCPASALAMGEDGIPVVNLDRCFGCAVCATGCPSEAILMETKPTFPAPPRDLKEFFEKVSASEAVS